MKTTLDELKAFVAVVDSGSITAAAEELELTISATSRTLARLEDKLQTTLLRRTTRRLELTEEGAAFLEYARTILATVDEAEEQMAARRLQPVGRLRVDAATPFMLHVIVPTWRSASACCAIPPCMRDRSATVASAWWPVPSTCAGTARPRAWSSCASMTCWVSRSPVR